MSKKKDEKDPTTDNAPHPAEHSEASKVDSLRPAPPDAPLMSLPDAASYLRMTVVAFRALLESDTSEFAQRMRGWLVTLSPRRRYIQREPFMAWLRSKCDATNIEKGQK